MSTAAASPSFICKLKVLRPVREGFILAAIGLFSTFPNEGAKWSRYNGTGAT
jgi:hypothetical protein